MTQSPVRELHAHEKSPVFEFFAGPTFQKRGAKNVLNNPFVTSQRVLPPRSGQRQVLAPPSWPPTSQSLPTRRKERQSIRPSRKLKLSIFTGSCKQRANYFGFLKRHRDPHRNSLQEDKCLGLARKSLFVLLSFSMLPPTY